MALHHLPVPMRNPGHESRDLARCIRLATADCRSTIEFGCMFGDQLAGIQGKRIGVEVHPPYVQEARARYPAIDFIRGDARDVARLMATTSARVDAVLMIDFIEHLSRHDAKEIVTWAKVIAAKRIVLFVPLGNHPQTTDYYNTGADHWQTHRSTWDARDLTIMDFDVAEWGGYHDVPGKDSGAAFAVWEA
jgi:hypothetical protein